MPYIIIEKHFSGIPVQYQGESIVGHAKTIERATNRLHRLESYGKYYDILYADGTELDDYDQYYVYNH